MRIFIKKAFKFRDPEGQQPDVHVQQLLTFHDVPDWVQHTHLFQWAKADGDIQVSESRSEESQIEKDVVDPELAELRGKAKELGVKGYASMKRETLEAKIAEAEEAAKKNPDDGNPNDGNADDGTQNGGA